MSYGELYYFDYNDYLGRKATVKILQDGFSGSSTEILAAGDPIIIETKSDNDYLFNQIYGSECTINIISTSNFQFVGLFTANAYKNKIEVWLEPEPDELQKLYWTGFILPDQYSEPIDYESNYPVTLVARDGLGALKNIDFLQDTNTPYVGKIQVIKLIAEILKKIKLDININFGINLLENNAPTGETNDTLENIYLDYGAFYQDKTLDCEYVLKQILQSFGARIIQANGEWWIERVPMYLASQSIHKYDKDGIFISSSTVSNQINYTGKYDATNNRLFFAEKKGNLEVNPAYKEFDILQNYGKLKSIIKNYDFNNFTETIIYGDSSRGGRGSVITYSTVIENWTEFPFGNTDFRVIDVEGKKCLFPPVEFDFDSSIYVKSDSVYITVTAQYGIKITMNYRAEYARTRYEIKHGGKWLNADGNYYDTQQINIAESTGNAWTELSFVCKPSVDYEGVFYVKIFVGDVDGGGTTRGYHIDIDNFLVEIQRYYPESAEYNIIIDENNNFKPNSIKSILGDLPEIEDAEDVYIGGYWYFDGVDFVPTSSWSYYGSSRELSLIPLLAEAINDQYREPKHKISGLLIGNFKLNKAVYITMLQNRLYLPIRTTISHKYCKTDIEAIEIVPETEADGGVVWGDENQDYVVSETDVLTKV